MPTHTIAPTFNGPLTPPSLIAWLNRCEDSFANYNEQKPDKPLSVAAQIRHAGTAMQHDQLMYWWDTNRVSLKALDTWQKFVDRVKERFVASGWKLEELRAFYAVRQGRRSFRKFAQDLDVRRSALGTTGTYGITDSVMKRHLLLFATEYLTLRIMANPTFDLKKITLEALTNLLLTTWDSLTAEGGLQRTSTSPRIDVPSVTSSTSAPALTLLSPEEFKAIQDASGCFSCKKTPKAPKWIPHQSHNCPGDEEKGIPPGRNYRQPKIEPVAAVLPVASVDVIMPPVNFDDDYDSEEEYSYGSEILVTAPWDS